MKRAFLLFLALALLVACTPAPIAPQPLNDCAQWSAGFADEALPLENSEQYYLAGYHNGVEPEGVLDLQRTAAFWLDDGHNAVVIISVDCIGLDGRTVGEIRSGLADLTGKTGCVVHVVSTHTHAGVDTLGLWGPVGINGKNERFMENLVKASVRSAWAAFESRAPGDLYYSRTPVEDIQEDSRYPYYYDNTLYQLRFDPEGEAGGIRVISFAAHAEALRGENRMVSGDYPRAMADVIQEKTGDRVLFLPGAIGGLIMTRQLSGDRQENLRLTAQRLAEAALSTAEERSLEPSLCSVTRQFTTCLENTLFLYYRFLGILGTATQRKGSDYYVSSQLSLLRLDTVTLALLPGEVFPELVLGPQKAGDPVPLGQLAKTHGFEELVVIGLADDELGYVIPPGSFALHGEYPYVTEAPGHYEETNSVGPNAAADLAAAFRHALEDLDSLLKADP